MNPPVCGNYKFNFKPEVLNKNNQNMSTIQELLDVENNLSLSEIDIFTEFFILILQAGNWCNGLIKLWRNGVSGKLIQCRY